MQVADDRHAAHDAFAVELEHEADGGVGGGMLRSEVERPEVAVAGQVGGGEGILKQDLLGALFDSVRHLATPGGRKKCFTPRRRGVRRAERTIIPRRGDVTSTARRLGCRATVVARRLFATESQSSQRNAQRKRQNWFR